MCDWYRARRSTERHSSGENRSCHMDKDVHTCIRAELTDLQKEHARAQSAASSEVVAELQESHAGRDFKFTHLTWTRTAASLRNASEGFNDRQLPCEKYKSPSCLSISRSMLATISTTNPSQHTPAWLATPALRLPQRFALTSMAMSTSTLSVPQKGRRRAPAMVSPSPLLKTARVHH